MSALMTLLKHIQNNAAVNNHRQLLRIQGELDWCFNLAQQIVEHLETPYFWCGPTPAAIKPISYKQILGQETSLLIINAHQTFDGNAFAAGEGTLRGGGLLILLTPAEIPADNLFYQYVDAQLQGYHFFTLQQDLPFPVVAENPPLINRQPALNLSQQDHAVAQIIKTVTGHRRRPLVLTANRGRGKSASLGIAAAKLLGSGRVTKILVCAPNKQATQTLFKHANLLLTPAEQQPFACILEKRSIEFAAPDALLEGLPQCDLLIIDEAAALPVATLEALLVHYSRVVFATTQHGYEGSGRGFALRFQKRLNELAPQWRKLHLDQPIRWAKNDPLESFTLNSICLSEPLVQEPQYNPQDSLCFEKLSAQQLLSDHNLLQSLFSLLVLAHYQSKPSDLEKLLNEPLLHIFVARQNEQILAVVLINEEGNFDPILAEQIWQGTRRVPGNLIAQSLTFHSRFKEAAAHRYARIQRIAIHPACQNLGVGKQFISYLSAWAEKGHFDHLCASFGVTAELLSFWQQQGFTTLRIGQQQDASSGTHSIIVNLPLSQRGQRLHKLIIRQFMAQLPTQLGRQLQQLDTNVVLTILLNSNKRQPVQVNLQSYTEGNLPYEFIEHALIDLMLNSDLTCLTNTQQLLAIAKILQNNSWAEICRKQHFTGKKQAQITLKETIRRLTING